MFAERLQRELSAWVEDGIVSREQAQRIRLRYQDAAVSERGGRVVSTLAVIGAVVVGLGVILFFAANWDALPRPSRVALLLAIVVGAYGGGYLFRYGPTTHPAVGHAFLLVGALAFGASLFLVGQMYHVQAHDPLAFLAWAVAAAATGAVARSSLLASLAVLAFGGWLVYEAVHTAGDDGIGYVPVVVALYGVALYGLGTWAHGRLDEMRVVRALGLVIAAVGLFVFTFRGSFEILDEDGAFTAAVGVGFGLLAVAAAGGAAVLALTRRPTALVESLALSAGVVLVVAAVLLSVDSDSVDGEAGAILLPVLFNILFAAIAVGAILVGYANDEVWLVNMGIAFVSIDIFARYLDFFWDMLPRSLVFVGAGVLLLGLAFGLGRQRARLVERMETS